jgi:hypothetical protein
MNKFRRHEGEGENLGCLHPLIWSFSCGADA